jgi:Gluconate 2-dehydrogenase subunit 3
VSGLNSEVRLRVASVGAEQRQKLSRREIVQKLLGGMAAGAGLPLLASSHPIYQLLADDSTVGRAEEMRGAIDWKPLFLSTEQNATLVAVSEVVVPGSTSANVNRFIDLLLSVDTAEHQREFTTALAAVDDEAKQRFGRMFAELAQSGQVALLTDFSKGGEHQKEFHNLKEWFAGAYYSSEQGMRELGWDGNYVFDSYPGCEHGEQH